MSQIDDKLIYEILKKLQDGQARVLEILADHSRQFIRIREDINGLRGDDLRRETMQAQIDTRLDRIEARLNLSDAE
ncbi:MAG: hypothetical protein WA324_18395 [Bryobacteraceae bacterium]